MPHVHNGIGTWYYGKRRIHTRKGSCEFCGNFTELRSYDTTLFIVVVMIPVIPLARKRILEDCAVCRQHRVLPLKDWESAKVNQGAEVLEKLRSDPGNRESLRQAIVFAMAYQDEPLFDQLVVPLAQERRDDAALQAELANAHAYFAHWPQAEQANRAALALEDNDLVRERLAWALLKQGRPLEARPLLQHILDKKISESAGMIYFQVLGYQAEGLHEEALALMDQRDAAFPELAGVKDYQKQRKLSLRHRNSQKRIRSAILDEGKSGYRAGNWTAQLPRWIGALVLLGALAFYLGSAMWIGQARQVFLVNGTNQPYSVVIDGLEQRLPVGATPVRIAEGDVEVAFADAKRGLEPFRCRVESSFWSRPFVSPTIVINPDQAALIVEEESSYAAVAPPPSGPPRVHIGRGFYSFAGIDYEFQPFPATIQVSGNQVVKKTRVGLEPVLTPETRLSLMLQYVDPKDQPDYCKRLLRLDPNNVLFLSWLGTRLSAEPMLDFLKSHLDDRPLQVDWHRLFQTLMERAHPEIDLLARYQQIVTETGGNADAVYLLGRIQPDPDKAEQLIGQAADQKPPSGYAMYAMGYRALSEGRFADAVGWFDKALPLVADKALVQQLHHESLLANGDYERLLDQLNAQARLSGNRGLFLNQLLRVHAARGDKEKTRAALTEALQTYPPEQRAVLQKALAGTICCYERDLAGFLKAAAESPDSPYFELAFLQGKLEFAAELAKQADRDAEVFHALLYLEAIRAGAKERAATHWQALLTRLAKGPREERLLGDLLAGRKTLAEHPVQRLLLDTRSKRVLLAVVAERFPEHAKETLALAKRLDFHRDAISLCLQQVLPSKDAGPGPNR